jgi:hypothetical protein
MTSQSAIKKLVEPFSHQTQDQALPSLSGYDILTRCQGSGGMHKQLVVLHHRGDNEMITPTPYDDAS